MQRKPSCLRALLLTGGPVLHFIHSIISHSIICHSLNSQPKVAISQEWLWWDLSILHAMPATTDRLVFSFIIARRRDPDLADIVNAGWPLMKLMEYTSASDSGSGSVTAGFTFVYFEDERDAEDAIRGLGHLPFGYDRRRLSVEWAKGERGRPRDGSRSMTNQRPTKTLFVINFDPIRKRVRDIEKHFEPYGKVLHVRIRRNFAFVQFETQEDATKALECTHMSKILDRVVSVEYALKDDGEREDRYDSPRRGYGGRRGDGPYRHSHSPVHRRGRSSPDYGRARSPVYNRYNGPSYDRHGSLDTADIGAAHL